jgi:hypothetical protein
MTRTIRITLAGAALAGSLVTLAPAADAATAPTPAPTATSKPVLPGTGPYVVPTPSRSIDPPPANFGHFKTLDGRLNLDGRLKSAFGRLKVTVEESFGRLDPSNASATYVNPWWQVIGKTDGHFLVKSLDGRF